MRKFLIIEDNNGENKIEVTNATINLLKPIIYKINNKDLDYKNLETYEVFKDLYPFNDADIISINIVYHN
jgi:hypothetical protein